MKLRQEFIEVSDVATVENLWRSLEARAANNNIFYSYSWVKAWYQRFGSGRSLVLWVGKSEDGCWHFLFPLIQVPAIGGFGLWPVSYHTIDWVNPISGKLEIQKDFYQTGLKELLKHYQFIWLPLLREDDFTNTCLELSSRKIVRPSSRRSYFNFPTVQESRANMRDEKWGKKQIKNISYLTRKLESAGTFKFEVFDSSSIDFHSLLDLENKSWKAAKGQGLFNIVGIEDVYKHLLAPLIEEGKIRVSCLKVNDQMIAYEIGFVISDEVYGLHHIAFDQEWEKYSPGKLLMDFNIQFCLDNGFRIYDFLQGDNEYKKRWADTTETLTEVSLYARGFRAWVLHRITRFVQSRRKNAAGN